MGERAGMPLDARTSRDIVRVAKIVEHPANETTDWACCEGERSAEYIHRLQHRVCRRLGCALGRCRDWG